MKFTFLILFLFINFVMVAQSNLSLQIGWTHSKVRVIYDKSKVIPGVVTNEFSQLRSANYPYLGISYDYKLNNIHFTTGLSFSSFGSRDIPAAPDHDWLNSYATIPLSVGYHIVFSKTKKINLVVNLGLDLGYRVGNGVLGDEKWWGLLNLTTGIELTWKRFKLGTRGHWGMNNFFEYYPFQYRHTGLTTYLGYTFWDSKKAKAKRLERQQRKQLEK